MGISLIKGLTLLAAVLISGPRTLQATSASAAMTSEKRVVTPGDARDGGSWAQAVARHV